MNLHDAQALARELMQRHGLHDWAFAFDRARRRFGACHFTLRRITLSRHLTQLNGEDQVRDTLLHEIAHALTPGAGHGPRWRARCLAIGAKPQRCYRADEVVSPPGAAARLQLGCVACGWWVERHRIRRAQLICKRCRGEVIYRHKITSVRFAVVRTAHGWLRQRR